MRTRPQTKLAYRGWQRPSAARPEKQHYEHLCLPNQARKRTAWEIPGFFLFRRLGGFKNHEFHNRRV